MTQHQKNFIDHPTRLGLQTKYGNTNNSSSTALLGCVCSTRTNRGTRALNLAFNPKQKMNEIALTALVGIIGIFVAYRQGQLSILDEWEQYKKKREEREIRWREFEEEE